MACAAGGKDNAGFSLIELLVVVIVIGILAAIAIPVYLNQRAKAHDTSTKADVERLGKELMTFYVDRRGVPSLDFSTPGSVAITDGTVTAIVDLTNGTARPVSGASGGLAGEMTWCVSLTDAGGSDKDYKYTALDGLDVGTC